MKQLSTRSYLSQKLKQKILQQEFITDSSITSHIENSEGKMTNLQYTEKFTVGDSNHLLGKKADVVMNTKILAETFIM